MASFITNEMGGTPKPNYDVFIYEFNDIFCYVIPKCLSFHLLSGVVNGYNNIPITNNFSCEFNRSHKV